MCYNRSYYLKNGENGLVRPELTRIYKPELERSETTTIVWCHGGQSHPDSMAPLAPYFREYRLVLPTAPLPAANGYDWVKLFGPNLMLESEGLEVIHEVREWIRALRREFPGTLVLGGLSQGAVFAGMVAVESSDLVDGLFVLSGFVPTAPPQQASLQALPVFVGYGTQDTLIPVERVNNTIAMLMRSGATVESHSYPMGHELDDQEIADLVTWIKGINPR